MSLRAAAAGAFFAGKFAQAMTPQKLEPRGNETGKEFAVRERETDG